MSLILSNVPPPPTPQELVAAFVERQPAAKRIEDQLLHILTFVEALGDIKAALSTRIKMLKVPSTAQTYRLAELFIKTEHTPEVPEWINLLDELLLGTALAMSFSDAILAGFFFMSSQYELLCVPFVEHMHNLLQKMEPEEAAAAFALRDRMWLDRLANDPALRAQHAVTMRNLEKEHGIVAPTQKE